MRTVLSHELKRLFAAPYGWILLALLGWVAGWRLLTLLEAAQHRLEQELELAASVTRVVVQPVLAQAAVLIALAGGLLALRLWGAERRRGTDQLWLSLPCSSVDLILGQWLAHAILLAAAALLAGGVVSTVVLGAPIDLGTVAGATAGLIALAFFVAALAGLWSAAVPNPGLACLLTLMTLLAFWAPDAAPAARGDLDSPLRWIAISRRLHPFLNGEIRLADLGFFIAATLLCLGLWVTRIHRDRPALRAWRLTALSLVALMVAAASQMSDARWDLTRLQRNTLPEPVKAFLAGLSGPVEVLAIKGPATPASAIQEFLERFRRHHRALSLQLIDPAERPDEVLRLNLEPGELLVRHAGRSTRIRTLNYGEFTNALARLARPAPARVAYAFGSGERDLRGQANHDWGRFGNELAEVGITATPLDLVINPAVPDDLDLLIVAAGDAMLLPGVDEALAEYVRDGGPAVLWAGDASAPAHYRSLLGRLGVDALPGTLVDARARGSEGDDPRFLEIRRFPDHPLTRDLGGAVLLPIAIGWRSGGGAWVSTTLLESGPASWNETGTIAGTLAPDEVDEIRGPLPAIVALERGDQRAIVSGDGDFLSNRFIGNGANAELGIRMVRWLLRDDQRVQLPVRTEPDRSLHFGERTVGWLGAALLVGLPGLMLLVALGLWWRRRA